jgi:hypothetical protein
VRAHGTESDRRRAACTIPRCWLRCAPCPGICSCYLVFAPPPTTTGSCPSAYGQTISQPAIVAVMTELLEPHRAHRGVGDWHRFGLLGGSALAPGEASIYDRNHRRARTGRGDARLRVRCSSYCLRTWVSLRGCLSRPARNVPSQNGDLTKRLELLLRSSLTSSLLAS